LRTCKGQKEEEQKMSVMVWMTVKEWKKETQKIRGKRQKGARR
jgi:hypothetical protein